MKIIIEPYNALWAKRFEEEKKIIGAALKIEPANIEHIGSTSVVGLGAKPIIDIMVGLSDFLKANDNISLMQEQGYEYVSKHENVMPNRRFFVKERNGQRTHHVHMVGIQTEFWKRHLRFRNHLRTNEIDRRAYFELKVDLSKREWESGSQYANAKSDFIQGIEKKIVNE